MKSRGLAYTMGAGARRSLVLSWTALFLCSLLLQYTALASPATVLAVHDNGLFELDGNVENQAAPGDDWNAVFNGADSAVESVFITDPINGDSDKYFDGGSTKDVTNISSWLWTTVSQPQDKNDIAHAYAAAYRDSGNLIVYFGLDRYASNGAAQVGFWFLQGEFGLTGGPRSGAFAGTHHAGDVLVQIDFENGGANPVLRVYEWSGGLTLVSSGGSCATTAAGDTRCAIAATSATDPAWAFDDKFAGGANNDIPAGGMVEGGIDLTALGLDSGCFASFVAETRSSPSPDSTLSDFASGTFALCSKPKIETEVRQDGQPVSSINMGETVYDYAHLTGDSGPVTGSVKFHVCRDADARPDCSSGGTQVGQAVQLNGGEAESANFTPTQLGYYCFRAEYAPADGSKYLADSHTNKTTECFRVIPADVFVKKTAGPTPVSAGDDISFTLSWGNKGEGKATGVVVTDNLPGDPGLDWEILEADGSGTTCAITGPLGAEVLTCNIGSINGNVLESGTVTVGSGTSPASCGKIDNTGSITSANDGSGSDSASVEVDCPALSITKTADAESVSAGDDIGFTITVTNDGPGVAKDVQLNDPLPDGVDWDVDGADAAACSIVPDVGTVGQVLSCDFDDMADDASVSVHLSATTGPEACSVYDNEATAWADNHDEVKANASITCRTPDIHVEKTGNGPLDAGDDAVFTITVSNDGDGRADNVVLTDDLPDGIDWSTETEGCSIVPDVGTVDQVLTCKFDAIAAHDSRVITVTGKTLAASCPGITNTASADVVDNEPEKDRADNSGTGSIVVNCGDITLTKKADASPILAGSQIGFTIEVTNTGDGTAKDVWVTDVLPDGPGLSWSVSPAVEGCSIAAGTLTCDLGDMAADDSVSIHLVSPTTTDTCGSIKNTASVTTSNDGSDDGSDEVEVQCASIDLVKLAASAPDGTVLVTMPGTVVFQYEVTNTGTATLGSFHLVDDMATPDDTSDDLEIDCLEGKTLGPDESMTCLAPIPVGFGLRTNWAVVTAHPVIEPEAEVSATDDAVVRVPQLVIDKSVSDAALLEGDITTFTLAWTLTDGPVTDGVITDVLPEGLVYLDESATDSDEFEFVDYDEATRTLTWTAATVTKDGSVTYQVAAEDGSADLAQPLENVATIDSDETTPDSDTEKVVVGKVEEETGTPDVTPPATSTIDQAPATGAGNGLTLLLVAIGGLTLLAGLLVPTPARARNRQNRRNRRG